MTVSQAFESESSPESRITVGLPVPLQLRKRLYPPTSTLPFVNDRTAGGGIGEGVGKDCVAVADGVVAGVVPHAANKNDRIKMSRVT